MISYIRTLFTNAEREREMKREQFDLENQFLDFQLKEEENRRRKDGNPSSEMESIISPHREVEEQKFNNNDDINKNKEGTCVSRKGVVTSLTGKNGAIDTYIYFDSKAAEEIFHELSIGCVVEYLTFQKNPEDTPRVVKVQRIVEDSWEIASENKVLYLILKQGNY